MFEKWTREFYREAEYPALLNQRERFEKEKPFLGLKILDNTPVFRNTLLKYEALLCAGAELFIANSPLIPHDEKIFEVLLSQGIKIVGVKDALPSFDLVLDCASVCRHVPPRFGAVELTRSGLEPYEGAPYPVFIADSSEIKKIETSLGTGESYFRAMEKFGFPSLKNKPLLVFGFGKVGSGIVHYALKYGALVTVVADFSLGMPQTKEGLVCLDMKDYSNVAIAIENTDFLVTATGKKNALAIKELQRALEKSSAVFANMGVEDEYGEGVSKNRVLFEKKPLNFSLEEPTHLKFMDATMALHNALGEYLVTHEGLLNGVNPLPLEIEREILEITRKNGEILN